MTQPLFVTNDPTRWGDIGVGPLDDYQVDQNFWNIHVRLRDLEAAGLGVGLADITIPFGNTLRFTFTDHSHADVTIPFLYPRARGEWAPGPTTYAAFDYFSFNGRSYLVLYPHVAGASFDADAVSGSHQLYGLLLDVPSTVIPGGGDVPAFLGKSSATDFDLDWIVPTFRLLDDVALNSDLAAGDYPRWNGAAWINSPFELPPPTSGRLGGVMFRDPEAHKFMTDIDGDGIPQLAQPSYADLSGVPLSETRQQPAIDSGELTIDFAEGHIVDVLLSENVTSVVLANVPDADEGWRLLIQFISTGSFTVTGWPTGTYTTDGDDPTIATGSGARSRVVLSGAEGDGATMFLDPISLGYSAL